MAMKRMTEKAKQATGQMKGRAEQAMEQGKRQMGQRAGEAKSKMRPGGQKSNR